MQVSTITTQAHGWVRQRPSVVVGLLIVALLAGRVASVRVKTREVTGDPPVKKLTFYEPWVTVRAVDDAELSDLINLQVFRGFKPGDPAEAIKRFGPPDKYTVQGHARIYDFWIENDALRFMTAPEDDGSGTDAGEQAFLQLRPAELDGTGILCEAIHSRLDPTWRQTKVTIKLEHDYVVVALEGTQVRRITWSRWCDRK